MWRRGKRGIWGNGGEMKGGICGRVGMGWKVGRVEGRGKLRWV